MPTRTARQGGNPAGNSNAYLTRITCPTPADRIAQQEKFTYNYSTGELASAIDENGKTTSYTYSDPLNRLTNTSYPDGGATEQQRSLTVTRFQASRLQHCWLPVNRRLKLLPWMAWGT